MTTTVSAVLSKARNYLMNTQRDDFNTLASDLTDTVGTTVSVNLDASLITAGSYIEIDLEVMIVTAVSSTTLTVIRGAVGSTAATHTANTLIRVNPTFFDFMLFGELAGELMDLCAPDNGLFKETYVDLTYIASRVGYDLTGSTTVDDLLDVRYQVPGSWKAYPRANVTLARDMPTTDFASGNAVFIAEGGSPGRTVRVFYKSPYTVPTGLSDTLESTCGMHAEAVDIPAIGVAIRATLGREITRNFFDSQGDTRRATEVPPGANNSAPAGLRQLRQQRIQAEYTRLRTRWPGFARQT